MMKLLLGGLLALLIMYFKGSILNDQYLIISPSSV